MTPFEAMNEITAMLLAGYGGAVKLPNRAFTVPADPDAAWIEVTFQHTANGQASLANVNGVRHYEATGGVTLEMFFPDGIGVERPYDGAEAVALIFRGKHSPSSGVWFRDVAVTERLPSRHRGRYQMDVSFTFEYDQYS